MLYSIAILVGLIIMMWPVLTKVQYEVLPLLFRSRRLWVHIAVSCLLNWILAPFVMLAVGMALPKTLRDRS
jgi:ACR3 family arsenite transporter